MPISCETCREALHSHLADFIAPKSGEAPVLATAPIQESAPEGAALSSTRRSEIEAHLTQCADCARELALLRGVTVELHSLPAVPAPLDLRARIQAQIASEVQAAPQPVATRATANQKRNSAASWFGLWRDFWRRSARVAWAGAALTGLLLLLAIQTNLPLPTSQSGSFTAPESSPPAAMIPGSPQPPQTTIRPIPGRNAPRSTAQQSTKRNSTDRGESARQSDQAQVLRDTSPSQQSAPPTSAQPQLKASTRAPSTREQITTAEAREPQSRSDATAPSTATPAIRPGEGTGDKATSKSVPTAARKTLPAADNALPTREAGIFARLEVEKRSEQQALQGPAALAPLERPAAALAPIPAQENRAVADSAIDNQEHNRARGGGAPGGAQAPPQVGTFSMRRRDAASAGAASPGAAPAGVGARPEATQRSAPDNQQKAMSAAERSQSIAPGETGATSTRGASGLANENAGTAGALQMPSAPRRNNSLEALNDGDTLATARLVVAPPRDLSRARLRVVGAGGVRLSQSSSQQAPPQKASSQIVWSGTARRGQEITVPLRLQIVVPGTLRVILEEAAGSGWKTVREQNLSVWSR